MFLDNVAILVHKTYLFNTKIDATVYLKNYVYLPPTTGVGEDAGKKEPSYTVGRNVN
jgi:hypothetical protein